MFTPVGWVLFLLCCSAGATGVMLNVDAVQDLVRGPLGLRRVPVRGVVDSGWFLDRPPYSLPGPGPAAQGPARALSASDAVRQGVALWKARVPPACVAHYRTEPWRCYFGYRLYPTIRGTPHSATASSFPRPTPGAPPHGLGRPFRSARPCPTVAGNANTIVSLTV